MTKDAQEARIAKLPRLSLTEYKADQERLLKELVHLQSILEQEGVPTHRAAGRLVQGLPRFSLHQNYIRMHNPSGEEIDGVGESLHWGIERLDFAPRTSDVPYTDPFRDHEALLAVLCGPEPWPDGVERYAFRLIHLSYWVGFGGLDSRFFVSGFFPQRPGELGRMRWVLTKHRHARLSSFMHRRKRANELFGLKHREHRPVTYEDAVRAIRHYASVFMEDYKPFDEG